MTSAARRLAEHLLRDKTRQRQLSAEFGHAPIIMSSAGGLGALLKPIEQFDPLLLAIAKATVRPGNVVWDVGANVGLFSVAASALAGELGQVFSFEPDVVLVQLLRKTARLQPTRSAPITIVPCAVASATGVRSFAIARRARASNALREYGLSQMGGVAEVQTVIAMPLDELAGELPRPNVLKIDVEGAEMEVLTGGAELLRKLRPLLVCEISKDNAVKASKLLREADYVLFDGTKPLTEKPHSDVATWSTIAVPEERVTAFVNN